MDLSEQGKAEGGAGRKRWWGEFFGDFYLRAWTSNGVGKRRFLQKRLNVEQRIILYSVIKA